MHDKYKTFADHPLSPMYFKAIELLISKDVNQNIEHYINLAHQPLTNEVMDEISLIMVSIDLVIREKDEREDDLFSFDENNNMTH